MKSLCKDVWKLTVITNPLWMLWVLNWAVLKVWNRIPDYQFAIFITCLIVYVYGCGMCLVAAGKLRLKKDGSFEAD